MVFLASTILATVSGTSTNLALASAGGIASQACEYDTSGQFTASKGIDGIITPGGNGNMFHTCFNEANTWWQVVLPEGDSVIETIKTWNRLNVWTRLQNSKIQVFNETDELQYEHYTNDNDDWNKDTITLNFDPPIVGNRVRIQKYAMDDTNTWVLNMKEVQVFGSSGTTPPTASPTNPPTAPPTKAPTSSPTATPASEGSFEIHSTGNVTGTATSGTTIELLAPYNASNREHKTTVLTPDCITPFPEVVAEAFTVTNTEPMSLGDGFIAYNSTIAVDISKVNETTWWTALSGGALGGVLDVCLESAIYLSLSGELEKMNFVNTNLTLTVEMDANFEVTTIDAERKDATQENLDVDYSDYVTAYQCVESDLVNKATNQEYSQGDELKICVKSLNPAIVEVESIKSLTLSQEDAPSGNDFDYITDGLPVDDEIAATDCDTNISPNVCHADMQLLGRYFAVESPGDLTASGSVELTFSTGRRLTVDVPIAGGIRGGDLALENSARRMEQETPENSPFDVKVSLKSVDGSGGTNDFNGATLLSGMVAAAAGGAILMV